MGNKKNRQSRRLETPSPEREIERNQTETPIAGNVTLTNNNTVIQSNLGENNSENILTEPSQVSNEIQVWTQIMEQKSNDRIEKMREEMDNKLEAILKEIKTNKTSSAVTNPRSDTNELQESQQSGSRMNKSMGVRASNNENSDYENDDFPPKVSKMKDLKHPADPLYQNESVVDVTILPDEESDAEEVEDYRTRSFVVLRYGFDNEEFREMYGNCINNDKIVEGQFQAFLN